jgi:hippurate hydrolase
MSALHPQLQAQQAQADEFIGVRRDIHRHPELGYKEFRTSDLVADKLTAWGYEVTRGIGGTGLVGQLKRGTGTKRLGLRAEMDALPIQETTGLDWTSQHAGCMHACGHDGHTTMLLAAAKKIAENPQFNGTLNLIFQPAEEGLAGARRMMDDGLFERFPCDAVFAMHNMPGHPQGHMLFRDGAMMASSDNLDILVEGRGGHGAMPHEAADPVVAGSAIVMGLQSIVARNVDPKQVAVITVGAFQAGEARNVIAHTATLRLSVRTLDREVRSTVLQRIQALTEATAVAYGVKATVTRVGGYPVLVNTPAEAEFARQVALELLGEDAVVPHAAPITASEDFAYMLEEVPGNYAFIGNGGGGGDGPICMVHNPGYDFNDANVPVGAAYWVLLTERYLR